MNKRFLRLSKCQATGVAGAWGETPRSAQEDATVIPRDLEVRPRGWAVFLLHAAKEIEHTLMVQYLMPRTQSGPA